jgi:hypothetical protein
MTQQIRHTPRNSSVIECSVFIEYVDRIQTIQKQMVMYHLVPSIELSASD